MINCVTLMGRLTADPELKTTTGGLSVTTFTIAVDRPYVRNGEERQTDFINIVAWRQSAEFVCRYFKKGQMIALTGSLQTRNYEDKNGNKRTAYEVVADRVSFCGSKAESGSASFREEQAAPALKTASASDFEEITDDEDLPF
ncbi:MAG: single-stranded DNA-binding protein [Oscillospiraceae bacterium]|nr:single-stranded DNA-binding protein [Oscillospiraceae bacterium]